MRLKDDWDDASILVHRVNTLLMFCNVQTGATSVVLSYDEHAKLPMLLLVEKADGKLR